MPIYEYRCDCGWTVEVFQKMDGTHTPPICPRCHKRTYRYFTPFTLKVIGGVSEQSKIDKEMELIRKAQSDTTPVTKTEQDVATEQLERRCDRRGEDFEKVRGEVFGGTKKGKIKDKKKLREEQRKKALSQRKLIDR